MFRVCISVSYAQIPNIVNTHTLASNIQLYSIIYFESEDDSYNFCKQNNPPHNVRKPNLQIKFSNAPQQTCIFFRILPLQYRWTRRIITSQVRFICYLVITLYKYHLPTADVEGRRSNLLERLLQVNK